MKERIRKLVEGLDARVATVLLTAAAVLLVLDYLVVQPLFLLPRHLLNPDGTRPLGPMVRWALLSFATYAIVPGLIVVLIFKERLSDFGLSFRGFLRHLPVYLAFYLVMVPVIWFASRQPAFLNTYPFTGDARNGLSDLLKWEAAYGMQFLGLEFFFRGFLVFGLAKKFGPSAIFVMVVPYCMIHFHKPMLEAAAAIAAGVILGVLAYRTKSILGGVFIHFAVAVTMDVLAILQTGGFR